MPFSTPLNSIPRLPAPQSSYTDASGLPTKEFFSFLTALRALLETYQGALGQLGTTVKTVSTLPSATGIQGARYIVTDSNSTTFMATVAGGGANIVPVFSNGTVWKIG